MGKGKKSMVKYSLRQIKDIVKKGYATDITSAGCNECYALLADHDIEKIGYSCGIYGLNGALLRDENGDMYAITSRSTSLFCMI